MNSNYNSKYQFSGSENLQPTLNQSSLENDMEAALHMNIPSAQYAMQINTTVNSPIVHVIDQQKPIQTIHPNTFFYQPSNDPCNYHIHCKEISLDTVIQR